MTAAQIRTTAAGKHAEAQRVCHGLRVGGVIAVATALGVVLTLGAPASARALQCAMQPDDLADAIAGDNTYGDTVVVATVNSVTDDNRFADVTVEQVLRGDADDELQVESEAVTAAADEEPTYGPFLPLAANHRYVFVGFAQSNGALLITACGPSREVTAAEAEALASGGDLADTAMARGRSPLVSLGVLLISGSLLLSWVFRQLRRRGFPPT